MKKEEPQTLKTFRNIANDLEDLIQPYKRFKKNESMFIKALEKGYWVLIDGIESANPVISDKLIGLCEENPELDLTETGENIIFSNNPTNKKIHPNFHLFINYNPFNKSNTNQLNEMFLNKCLTFTLSTMDADIESSAQIIYGFLKNSNNINEIICQDISSKVAIIHQEMNKKYMENQDFFSGGVEFTGRIIKFISEEISPSKDENDLCQNLVNAFYLNYINSINNKNDANNIKEVKNIIKKNLKITYRFDTGEKNIYLKYAEIFKTLRNIQKIAEKIIKDYDFDFYRFLSLLKRVEINDLYIIMFYIDETLKKLDKLVGDSLKDKLKYFQYFNLEIIKRLLQNIIDYVNYKADDYITDFTLNDEYDLISKSILERELSLFNLVLRLESKFKPLKLTDCFIYLPEELLEYLDSINKLLKNCDYHDLYENLKILNKTIIHDINLTHLFPFNQIILEKSDNNFEKIRMFKIIFLIYKMIENKVDFQFSCGLEVLKFNFKRKETEPFNDIYIIINITKDFYFENSQICIKKGEIEKRLPKSFEDINDDEEKININNWFYIICYRILAHKIEIHNNKKIFDIVEDVTENKIRILDKITEEFERDIREEKRAYRITKLISNPNEDPVVKEDNLIMKIWYLTLFYDEKKLELITPFYCLPFEKELLIGIKNLIIKYVNSPSNVSEIINFTKNFIKLKRNEGISYGNSNSLLYKIQAGFFNYLTVENKDKKYYCNLLINEIKCYDKLISPFEEVWSKEKSINDLYNQYLNLNKYIESC